MTVVTGTTGVGSTEEGLTKTLLVIVCVGVGPELVPIGT